MAVRIMKYGSRLSIKRNSNKAWFLFSSALCVTLFSAIALADVNYEELFASDIVLDSKKIEVPGFPGAFNPSIIRYRGRLLLSFRFIPDRKDNMTSYLGVMFLHEDLTPAGEARLFNLRKESNVKSRAEDARLLTIADRLYAVYSDNADPKISRGGFRVYVVQVDFDADGRVVLGPPEKLTEFEGKNPDIREKNWVAFDADGRMRMAYSIDPHLIFEPCLDGSGVCKTVCKSSTPLAWDYGHVRGGTPAFLLGDEYLAFFHSSVRAATVHSEGKDMMHYFMGAYTFEKNAPYKLKSMSTVPIVGKGFYSGPQFKGYWKTVRAIFPGGYVFDDDFIWVAYGKDDADVWVAKLDRRALMQSLVRLPE